MKTKSLSDDLRHAVATILATNNVSKISKKYIKSIQINDLNGNVKNFKNYEGLKRYLRNMAQKLNNNTSDDEQDNTVSHTIQLIMNYDTDTMERDIKEEVIKIFKRHRLEGSLYNTNKSSNRRNNNNNNRGGSSSLPPQKKK